MAGPAEVFPTMTCRKCETVNPIVFFGPVETGETTATCVCLDCAKAQGWLDKDDNIRPGHSI